MGGMSDRDAYIALAHCVEPGDASVGRLLAAVGPGALVDRIRAGRTGLRHGEGLAARLAAAGVVDADERAAKCDARIITRTDREWPTQLAALGEQVPLALWVRGAADLRLLALRSVAIVGARASTAYGEEVARMWSAELASDAWTVLSGAAFGIDAAAHRGALAAGGSTVAVLAGGVDVPYPRAHTPLLARIAEEGAVVSESPPGESVRRQRFLTRNRVIAALGRATLVVEAADRSGTTATARAASAMNRPVLAVPGPVSSASSAGCHRMIREGVAILVADVPDLLDMLDLAHGGRAQPRGTRQTWAERSRDSLGARERTVLDAFPAQGVLALDGVVRAAGQSHTDVLAALGLLAADGWIREEGGGWRLDRGRRSEGTDRAPDA